MKHLLTSLLVTVSMTLTTAMGMEDQGPFNQLPLDIQHEILGDPLKLSEEQVNTLRGLGQQDELKTLTDAQWGVLKSLNPEGIKDINLLSQTSKGMDTLMGDIMKGLKNLFPAMINHLGSFGIELNDEYFDKLDEQFTPSPSHINLSSFLSQHWLTLYDLDQKTGFITSLGKKNNNASEEFKRGMKTFNYLYKKQIDADEWYKKNPPVENGVLNLSNKKFYVIPSQVFKQLHLKGLNTYCNRIFFLPEEIGLLKELEELALSFNRILFLPKEIGGLKELKGLSLSINRILFFPKEIRELKELKGLNLSINRILFLPKEIRALEKFEELDLSWNKFTTIFDDQGTNVIAELIKNNQELKEINLENNPLDNASKIALRELEDKYPNMTIKW